MGNRRSWTGMLVGLAAATGVAAMMSAASAAAAPGDDGIYAPITSTFDSAPEPGYPPLVELLQGPETWEQTNLPAGQTYEFTGVDTHTTFFGSFTNDYLLTDGSGATGGNPYDVFLPLGTQIDLMNYGAGFENLWVDTPTLADGSSIVDTLITPFGDFTL